ncbi:ammonia-dependent NAD(+) synthetase [Alteribacillus iranensis]|uniref:NH(3)-dependent NAD(+) synthetase n=1 Tax=Alteribacillus iranensis TaxID=930128 RepID=A0A1I1ZYT0_9BACI|nr:ammonia-dependent NAD(+) synthetase [Alteribacillus iranensis]SFE36994.1 NH(3)-dependent NAD(+) synthetase [Alteribacillus iranensis]
MRVTQEKIIDVLKAKSTIDPQQEIEDRKNFLKEYAKKVGAKGYVLGISGGQDSTLAGKIAQMAVDELNNEEEDTYTFIALRLPYGKQFDEDDAVAALNYIEPTETYTINIQEAVDGAQRAFEEATGKKMSDFNKGNTKARERMKVHYDVAAEFNCLVLGTDHAAEAITGFFTKHGDGACDVAPLVGLNKRQGKTLLSELQAPPSTYEKVPTADLESDKPGLPDEEALGITYNEIDDFLEGKNVSTEVKEKLINMYTLTEHKRQMPANIYDDWWK